jgi:hypothetical protein
MLTFISPVTGSISNKLILFGTEGDSGVGVLHVITAWDIVLSPNAGGVWMPLCNVQTDPPQFGQCCQTFTSQFAGTLMYEIRSFAGQGFEVKILFG